MPTVSTKNLGIEHTEWVEKLRSLKDSLLNYKNQLTEIAGKQPSKELAQSIEHFQNQFIVQDEKISELKHDIKRHLKTNAAEMELTAQDISIEELNLYSQFKGKVLGEEKIFGELQAEFEAFVAKI
ncbi:MAG: hypothetical protein WCJ85_05570 [Chitinophagaceae bacterium]